MGNALQAAGRTPDDAAAMSSSHMALRWPDRPWNPAVKKLPPGAAARIRGQAGLQVHPIMPTQELSTKNP
jgi:hypothetical protein